MAPASKVGLNDLVGLHGRESDEDDPEEDEEPGRDDLDELRASEFSSGHLRMSADEQDEDGDLLGKENRLKTYFTKKLSIENESTIKLYLKIFDKYRA